MNIDDRSEWIEADGLGGFASGTAAGIRTRRYHALLLTATTPPTGRLVLVNGLDAWVDTPSGSFALSSQRYAPGVLHPDGAARVIRFTSDPWPTWEFEVPGGLRVIQEVMVEHGVGTTLVSWTLEGSEVAAVLHVRPFLSGRDYHSLHHENGAFQFEAESAGAALTFRLYDGVTPVTMLSNGDYTPAPDWYRRFSYTEELARGLDDTEDLAAPGFFTWPLAGPGDQAVVMLKAGERGPAASLSRDDAVAEALRIRATERRRRAAFATPLDRAADAYLVKRGSGKTIVAGYPWFTDWGRDTFIAVRGLHLATGRVDDARDVLVEWAGAVSEGMLPNRFPDHGEAAEFNSVDASLWYVVAVGELLTGTPPPAPDRRALERAILQIVEGYAAGTRHGIKADADGLLACGVPGQQLTWMDARVGDHVITPRIGKPVEVQALWLNALSVASRFDSRWTSVLQLGRRSFVERFWREDLGYLVDVIDVDHVPGTSDETLRPNQILAVGGLPLTLVDDATADLVVTMLERTLLTPMGLRSLAPRAPGYARRYEGGPAERDAIYHQGTVWPWLLGPFVEAWIRVRGNKPAARREARERFIEPLMNHLSQAGLGHVSEIADAEAPFTPRGCPFQAWSLGELLRLDRVVLADRRPLNRARRVTHAASEPVR